MAVTPGIYGSLNELSFPSVYDSSTSPSIFLQSGSGVTAGNVNCFRGLHEAVIALRDSGEPLAGACHWHGWHNGDEYDLWADANKHGAAAVQAIMAEL